jgi:hypothetical protein
MINRFVDQQLTLTPLCQSVRAEVSTCLCSLNSSPPWLLASLGYTRPARTFFMALHVSAPLFVFVGLVGFILLKLGIFNGFKLIGMV